MKKTPRFLPCLIAVILALPAFALNPSAVPKTVLPKGSAPPTVMPAPKPVLQKNIGMISGAITIYRTQRGGGKCTTSQVSGFEVNGTPVPAREAIIERVSANQSQEVLRYKILNRKPGNHIVAIQEARGCNGFAWYPQKHIVELKSPVSMNVTGKNFTYK